MAEVFIYLPVPVGILAGAMSSGADARIFSWREDLIHDFPLGEERGVRIEKSECVIVVFNTRLKYPFSRNLQGTIYPLP